MKEQIIYPANPHYVKEEAPASLEEKIAQAKMLDKAARLAAKSRRLSNMPFLKRLFLHHGS